MNKYFNVGKIVNTHGIKGEVKVLPLTDDVNNFKRYEKVMVKDEWKEILGVKFQKDRVILKLEGIESINEAETYKENYIYVLRENEPELDENTYYITDIIGATVFDTNNNDLGKIYDVIETKNNDVYWIKKPKELLIPVIDDIVLEIDDKNKKVIIKPVGEWQDED
ncbi:MAG: 16S rRNA processing protein RimM [Clostridiales bacterium]|nr:16S rRNA processing protein RimM [Clostridiales bacterium]